MRNKINCIRCGNQYPETGAPYLCNCGGLFDISALPKFITPSSVASKDGVWRYFETIQIGGEESKITLGEGNTPLLNTNLMGRQIYLKMESQNPTGSYKDRGTVTLVEFLLSRGILDVVEDSSGNAGASLAAYAARAGIHARIFAPESTSGPKRTQIEQYGADLVLIPGPRSAATRAVLKEVENGMVYASHAYMPFGLPGIASIAFEIVEQLGCAPGTVLTPVGHGGLLYGLMLGFESLLAADVIKTLPRYIGVQPANCAPLVKTFRAHLLNVCEILPKPTIAEGTSVSMPSRAEPILKRMYTGQGMLVDVTEEDILQGYLTLAHNGFYCEPTSALSLIPVLNDKIDIVGPTVAIITGSGLKANLKIE